MFTYIKRISLFILTNFAVLFLLGCIMSLINIAYPWLLSAYGDMTSLILYAALFGFSWSIVSLFISRWMAKTSYGIVLITRESASKDVKLQTVWETVERISTQNNITLPEIGYYESAEPNAFATGATKNSSLVAVSTWLLDEMDVSQIEWVIGHEMAHILNGDMVTLTLLQGVMNTFVIVFSHIAARLVSSFLAKDDEEEGLSYIAYQLVYMAFQLVFGALAMLVIMWFSRIREYRADLWGAQFTSKSKMIWGLKKLQALSNRQQNWGDVKMNAFMITEPDSFFSTHPSLDNRIAALEANYQLP